MSPDIVKYTPESEIALGWEPLLKGKRSEKMKLSVQIDNNWLSLPCYYEQEISSGIDCDIRIYVFLSGEAKYEDLKCWKGNNLS